MLLFVVASTFTFTKSLYVFRTGYGLLHKSFFKASFIEISEIAPEGCFLKEAIPTILGQQQFPTKIKSLSHKTEETYLGKA